MLLFYKEKLKKVKFEGHRHTQEDLLGFPNLLCSFVISVTSITWWTLHYIEFEPFIWACCIFLLPRSSFPPLRNESTSYMCDRPSPSTLCTVGLKYSLIKSEIIYISSILLSLWKNQLSRIYCLQYCFIPGEPSSDNKIDFFPQPNLKSWWLWNKHLDLNSSMPKNSHFVQELRKWKLEKQYLMRMPGHLI